MSGKYTVTIHVDEFESLVGGVGHALKSLAQALPKAIEQADAVINQRQGQSVIEGTMQ